jgi:hypothetical protein
MDKSLFMFRGGVRTITKKLADGTEHTIYYKAKTPNEIALFLGAEGRVPNDEKGDLLRQEIRANFIADSLCNEDGSLLMTRADALLIPSTLKPEICQFIVTGSNEIGDAGNVSPPEGMSGSGTS